MTTFDTLATGNVQTTHLALQDINDITSDTLVDYQNLRNVRLDQKDTHILNFDDDILRCRYKLEHVIVQNETALDIRVRKFAFNNCNELQNLPINQNIHSNAFLLLQN